MYWFFATFTIPVNHYINFAQRVFISLLIYLLLECRRNRKNLPVTPCDEPPFKKTPKVRNNKYIS